MATEEMKKVGGFDGAVGVAEGRPNLRESFMGARRGVDMAQLQGSKAGDKDTGGSTYSPSSSAEAQGDWMNATNAVKAAGNDHLARHKAADLFIDTFPYNAHTTCSDSLRVGLPVLTLQGETFASRGASSWVNAVGLKELITYSSKEYEDLAVEFATDASKLKNIKNKLEINKNKLPLFNTKLFTSHIEQAYFEMYKRYNKNEKPENIKIKLTFDQWILK